VSFSSPEDVAAREAADIRTWVSSKNPCLSRGGLPFVYSKLENRLHCQRTGHDLKKKHTIEGGKTCVRGDRGFHHSTRGFFRLVFAKIPY